MDLKLFFFLWFRFFESNWTILRKVYYGFRVLEFSKFLVSEKLVFKFFRFGFFGIGSHVRFLGLSQPDPSLPELPFYDLLY